VAVHEAEIPDWAWAPTLASCGVGYGLLVALLAVGLAGAGHGWGEASASSVAVVLAPLAGVAWAFRRRWAGVGFAALALAGGAAVDGYLWNHTSYADRMWEAQPGVMALWALLWVAWQAVALAALVWRLLIRA
jgi:hypothetical protein